MNPYSQHCDDYQRIAQAIAYIQQQAHRQPSLEDIAQQLQLSPAHFQRLFSRWVGVTPKRYLQIITLERAKTLLAQSQSVLAVSDQVGLSSGSRLYDHFVQLESVTPGEFKLAGAGLQIRYGVHPSPFGDAFVAITPRGLCRLTFLDDADVSRDLIALKNTWPKAELLRDQAATLPVIQQVFSGLQGSSTESNITPKRPLSLYVSGTNFQVNVWKALLNIPINRLVSYGQIASAIGHPSAVRALGSAVGANPIAFVIPCHRVIQQSGKLGGYRWGETRKHAIHAWEAARGEE